MASSLGAPVIRSHCDRARLACGEKGDSLHAAYRSASATVWCYHVIKSQGAGNLWGRFPAPCDFMPRKFKTVLKAKAVPPSNSDWMHGTDRKWGVINNRFSGNRCWDGGVFNSMQWHVKEEDWKVCSLNRPTYWDMSCVNDAAQLELFTWTSS